MRVCRSFPAFDAPLTFLGPGDSVPQNRAGIGPLGKDAFVKFGIALVLVCFPFVAMADELAVPYGAPAMGEHTDDVLQQAGFSAQQIAQMRSTGAI